MRIKSITISGQSSLGEFRGGVSLDEGFQLLVAPNRYGKSLLFAAAAWCLGVEHIFGVQAGNTVFFPDAVTSKLKIDGQEALVQSAWAAVTLVRDDGGWLTLTRAITGGNVSEVLFDNGELKAIVQIGPGSMQDSSGGFQHFFRAWAGMPPRYVLNRKGDEYPIYLENLASLFLIEQTQGWSQIQATQVHRYGLQEIVPASVEYLLGEDELLANRLAAQRLTSREAALREEAESISEEFSRIIGQFGYSGSIYKQVSLAQRARDWKRLNLLAWVREEYNLDYKEETKQLTAAVTQLRKKLSRLATDPEAKTTRAVSEASKRVLRLKARRHGVQERIQTARLQKGQQEALLESIDARRKSAKDLGRLKKDGVGHLPNAECPTCHQNVSPAALGLTEQSVGAIENHIEGLDQEHQMLHGNLSLLDADVLALLAQADEIERELLTAERTLKDVNLAVGPQHETMMGTNGEILQKERELDRLHAFHEQISGVQKRVTIWADKVLDMTGAPVAVGPSEVVREFERVLKENLAGLGCVGLNETEAARVELDGDYRPTLRGRGLQSYGSASDRARLVLAYTMALLSTGRRHPGFALLDEPLQQNPDDDHKARLFKFFEMINALVGRQSVVFTFLSPDQCADLMSKGVRIQQFEGKLLKLVTPREVEGSVGPNGA